MTFVFEKNLARTEEHKSQANRWALGEETVLLLCGLRLLSSTTPELPSPAGNPGVPVSVQQNCHPHRGSNNHTRGFRCSLIISAFGTHGNPKGSALLAPVYALKQNNTKLRHREAKQPAPNTIQVKAKEPAFDLAVRTPKSGFKSRLHPQFQLLGYADSGRQQ